MDAIRPQTSLDKKSQSPRKQYRDQNKHLQAGILHAPPLSLSSYPPLLPLPIPHNNRRITSLSDPPINHKIKSRSVNKTTKKNLKPQIKSNIKQDLAVSSGPDPSSLPLPTFFLRPKLRCKSEANGIDAGATDGLRRLLQLR